MSRDGESLMRPKTGGMAELRARVRQIPVRGVKLPNHKIKPPAAPKAAKPPKQNKHHAQPVDKRDEAAEKAERIAQQQHSTSLLKGNKRQSFKEAAPKGGAFAFALQLFAVILLCGGGALLMDPNVQAQIAAIDWDAVKEQLKLDQFGIE